MLIRMGETVTVCLSTRLQVPPVLFVSRKKSPIGLSPSRYRFCRRAPTHTATPTHTAQPFFCERCIRIRNQRNSKFNSSLESFDCRYTTTGLITHTQPRHVSIYIPAIGNSCEVFGVTCFIITSSPPCCVDFNFLERGKSLALLFRRIESQVCVEFGTLRTSFVSKFTKDWISFYKW